MDVFQFGFWRFPPVQSIHKHKADSELVTYFLSIFENFSLHLLNFLKFYLKTYSVFKKTHENFKVVSKCQESDAYSPPQTGEIQTILITWISLAENWNISDSSSWKLHL